MTSMDSTVMDEENWSTYSSSVEENSLLVMFSMRRNMGAAVRAFL